MVRTTPALSVKMACTQGRGGSSQSEAGGWPASTQGGTEGAKIEGERRLEEGSKESDDDKDHNKEDKGSESTSSGESETGEPTKPPAKTSAPISPSDEDIDEGKEGKADKERPSPCNA